MVPSLYKLHLKCCLDGNEHISRLLFILLIYKYFFNKLLYINNDINEPKNVPPIASKLKLKLTFL